MYRTLQPDKIIAPLEQLEKRIAERFPGVGLGNVCRELIMVARETSSRMAAIVKPNRWLRLALALLLVLGVAAGVWMVEFVRHMKPGDELFGAMQGIDAIVNLMIVFGGTTLFIVTMESRLKRRQALAALHDFRSIIHVIDMHQLTKDPTAMGVSRTDSSPARPMTQLEIVRYLDYCAEMLSLAAKVAALYAQNLRDPVVVDTVGDIERLTTNLSLKIWQKIAIIEAARASARETID